MKNEIKGGHDYSTGMEKIFIVDIREKVRREESKLNVAHRLSQTVKGERGRRAREEPRPKEVAWTKRPA